MNKSKYPKIALMLTACSFMLCSCEYNYARYEDAESTGSAKLASDVQPIFTAKCAACHNGSTANPDLTTSKAYNSLINGEYIDTQNPSTSKLMQKINDNHPTTNTLSSTQKNTILQWIQEGAANN